MRFLIIFLLSSCLSLEKVAAYQSSPPRVVQLFGIVLNQIDKEKQPLSMVTIVVKHQQRATFSNSKGGFSLAANEGDTIMFSHVGYKPQSYIVPSVPSHGLPFSYKEIVLQNEVYEIPEFTAKSLPTKAQFERDFVNMKFDNDLVNIASSNLDRGTIRQLGFQTPIDGGESVSFQFRKMESSYQYFGQQPGTQLLNPLAWAQFINQLKSGTFKLK